MPLVAASPLSAEFARNSRGFTALAVFPTALYLGVDGTDRVLPVLTADALLLPTGWRLPTRAPHDWGVIAGDHVPAGRFEPVRTWRPARVARRRPDRVLLPGLTGRIGRGPGLTPEGDDEVCGALLVAYAAGDDTLARAVAPLLGRTTSISAELLRAASEGYAVPQLVAYVDALLAGRPTDLLEAEVAAIGHTSGSALIRGVRAACSTLLTTTAEA